LLRQPAKNQYNLLNLNSESSEYLKLICVNIIPVIRDLLLRNQKAVIPGLGAFVMAQRPAQLNKVTRVLTPPSVTVRFDSRQHADDGQLTGYLTRKLSLDKDLARQAVDDLKKNIEEKLLENESFILEGLGKLEKKKTGETSFTPEDELLKRISLFEMPKIEIPQAPSRKVEPVPVVTTQVPVVTTPIPVPERQVPVENFPVRRSSRRWVIPVVLLGLLLGMLASIYITGNMGLLISDIKSSFGAGKEDTTEQLVFGNDAGNQQEQTDTSDSQVSRELDEQVDREKALAYDETEQKASGTETIRQEPVAENVTPAGLTYAKLYHIIAGSFTVLENAEKQRASMQSKGLNAEILPKKGNYYMVSLGSFDTREQASAARQQMEVKVPGELWIMRNK